MIILQKGIASAKEMELIHQVLGESGDCWKEIVETTIVYTPESLESLYSQNVIVSKKMVPFHIIPQIKYTILSKISNVPAKLM